MIMRILKAKITSEERINIEYQNNGDEFSLTSKQEAAPSFYEALNNLKSHVVEMCELPDEYLDRIIVRGVTFSYGGDAEVMGATIIAQMKLSHSNVNLNLNTPHKAEDSYSESPADPKQLLTDDCIHDLHDFQAEAEEYINGKRKQLNLYDKEK
jgi:hypothetical protein